MASHQAIREVINDFNAGRLMLVITIEQEEEEITLDPAKLLRSPRIDIEVDVVARNPNLRPPNPRIIQRTKLSNGSTLETSI